MNTDISDQELSPEQAAREQLKKDLANQRAGEDLEDWRNLERAPAFQRCFMRRLREKREAMEKAVLEGVPLGDYELLVARIELIREIEAMPAVEKTACFRHLNPGKNPTD
jgi:hypothetical protein